MAYTPPPHSNINIEVKDTYSPPSYDNVNIIMADEGGRFAELLTPSLSVASQTTSHTVGGVATLLEELSTITQAQSAGVTAGQVTVSLANADLTSTTVPIALVPSEVTALLSALSSAAVIQVGEVVVGEIVSLLDPGGLSAGAAQAGYAGSAVVTGLDPAALDAGARVLSLHGGMVETQLDAVTTLVIPPTAYAETIGQLVVRLRELGVHVRTETSQSETNVLILVSPATVSMGAVSVRAIMPIEGGSTFIFNMTSLGRNFEADEVQTQSSKEKYVVEYPRNETTTSFDRVRAGVAFSLDKVDRTHATQRREVYMAAKVVRNYFREGVSLVFSDAIRVSK